MIVDEFTGRLCPDRTWRDGLHQAVEAAARRHASPRKTAREATISRPAYFRLYETVCGMTGTAREAASELRCSYGLRTAIIPPNQPFPAQRSPDRVFRTRAAKLAAVVREIAQRRAKSQPVLVGTRTIENSEALADALAPLGFPFRILNAKQDAGEAAIIEQAGAPGTVTIATNMAGRGAHIPVPAESLRAGRPARDRPRAPRVGRGSIGSSSGALPDRARREARSFSSRSKTISSSATRPQLPRGGPAIRAMNCRPTPPPTFSTLNAKSKPPPANSAGSSRSYDHWLDELKQAL